MTAITSPTTRPFRQRLPGSWKLFGRPLVWFETYIRRAKRNDVKGLTTCAY